MSDPNDLVQRPGQNAIRLEAAAERIHNAVKTLSPLGYKITEAHDYCARLPQEKKETRERAAVMLTRHMACKEKLGHLRDDIGSTEQTAARLHREAEEAQALATSLHQEADAAQDLVARLHNYKDVAERDAQDTYNAWNVAHALSLSVRDKLEEAEAEVKKLEANARDLIGNAVKGIEIADQRSVYDKLDQRIFDPVNRHSDSSERCRRRMHIPFHFRDNSAAGDLVNYLLCAMYSSIPSSFPAGSLSRGDSSEAQLVHKGPGRQHERITIAHEDPAAGTVAVKHSEGEDQQNAKASQLLARSVHQDEDGEETQSISPPLLSSFPRNGLVLSAVSPEPVPPRREPVISPRYSSHRRGINAGYVSPTFEPISPHFSPRPPYVSPGYISPTTQLSPPRYSSSPNQQRNAEKQSVLPLHKPIRSIYTGHRNHVGKLKAGFRSSPEYEPKSPEYTPTSPVYSMPPESPSGSDASPASPPQAGNPAYAETLTNLPPSLSSPMQLQKQILFSHGHQPPVPTAQTQANPIEPAGSPTHAMVRLSDGTLVPRHLTRARRGNSSKRSKRRAEDHDEAPSSKRRDCDVQ